MKRNLTLVLLVITLISGFNFSSGRTYAAEQAPVKEPAKDAAKELEDKWGIRILSIRLSAGDHLLDFRYRVINVDKAAPLFDRNVKPYLIDLQTGAKCPVPESSKLGALRQTKQPYVNRNYFILFSNPGKYVKKGSAVAVVIGDFKSGSLTVR